jgi:hypothetical protein
MKHKLKSLLDKKEVEEAGIEQTTFCLASNNANHYTREAG